MRFIDALAVVACLVFAPAVRADDPIVIVDEEFGAPQKARSDGDIVIVDDDASADDDGVIHFNTGGDDDQLIIIVGDDDAPMPSAAEARGPLGSLWDSWHVALDSEVYGSAQLTDVDNGPFRLLGSLWVESWLLPTQNLSFYGNAVGRLAFDGTPEGRVVGFMDVYELYGKITLPRATVQIGRLVVPWGRTQAMGFGDRLQPPDLRRGASYPDPVRQKQPQLGAQVKGSLDVVGVEAVGFVSYEPTVRRRRWRWPPTWPTGWPKKVCNCGAWHRRSRCRCRRAVAAPSCRASVVRGLCRMRRPRAWRWMRAGASA